MTAAQPWQHLFSGWNKGKSAFKVISLLPPSVPQGCSPSFHDKLCRRAPAVTVELGGGVPDMETTGTQSCVSSAVPGAARPRVTSVAVGILVQGAFQDPHALIQVNLQLGRLCGPFFMELFQRLQA